MKVLFCHKFYYPYRGSERYVLALRENLSRLGHSVIDFSTRDERNVASAYSGYFVEKADFSASIFAHPLSRIRSGFNLFYSRDAARAVSHLIRDSRPDLAHIHNIYHHLSCSVLESLRRNNIPAVMTVHDYKIICPSYRLFSGGKVCQKCKDRFYLHALKERCLKKSYIASGLAALEAYLCRFLQSYEKGTRKFIAPSRFVRDKLLEFGVPEEKLEYLPYAIDLQGLSPGTENGGYVLYFGELSRAKGIITFLKSLEAQKELPVMIIGDGPQRKEAEDFCRRHRLSRVEFLGYMPAQELYPYIRRSLFVVVPSEWYEVSGLNIYESFACGKCVIGARVGGIPELVHDGRTGLLFDPGDSKELAEKIRDLVAHPEESRRMGENAREMISSFNNPEEHCRKLLAIYQKAVGGGGQG